MTRRRLSFLATAWTLTLLLGCASLPSPETDTGAGSETAQRQGLEAATESNGPTSSTGSPLPALPESSDRAAAEELISSEEDIATAATEQARSWSELTRLAREDVARFDYEQAAVHLDQAAMQVADLPSSHVRRRTVFGLRARLALRMASAGQLEGADALADRLFDEAEVEPAIAGDALVALALATADRREAAALETNEPASQLRLLRLAFEASEPAPASQDRLSISFRVVEEGLREGDLSLARRAIDRSILDAQRIAPGDKIQAGSLRIYRARIAARQGELDVALTSAESALRIFEEERAGDANIGIAESTLAEILASRGDMTRARELAENALARLDSEKPLDGYARRAILAAQARVDRASGETASARRHFERALALPAIDFELDKALTEEIRQELATLE